VRRPALESPLNLRQHDAAQIVRAEVGAMQRQRDEAQCPLEACQQLDQREVAA